MSTCIKRYLSIRSFPTIIVLLSHNWPFQFQISWMILNQYVARVFCCCFYHAHQVQLLRDRQSGIHTNRSALTSQHDRDEFQKRLWNHSSSHRPDRLKINSCDNLYFLNSPGTFAEKQWWNGGGTVVRRWWTGGGTVVERRWNGGVVDGTVLERQ